MRPIFLRKIKFKTKSVLLEAFKIDPCLSFFYMKVKGFLSTLFQLRLYFHS